jgi:hypothetical protein
VNVVRPHTNGMRWTLVISGMLTTVAGFQLVVGTEDTDRYFAWTIRPPLTAAFLGAAYWAALVLVALAARESVWANARVAVIAAVVLVPLIMLVTFIHLSKFHTGSDEAITLVGTWLFIATYVWLSALLWFFFIRQLRIPGIDPPRESRLPRWARATLAVQGTLLVVVALAFLVAPGSTADLWPWQLTELTARATGAWALAIGIAAGLGAREDDARRLRAPFAAYVTLALLAAVAIARYPDVPDWGQPGSWILVAVLASMIGLGVVGLALGRRSETTGREHAVESVSA